MGILTIFDKRRLITDIRLSFTTYGKQSHFDVIELPSKKVIKKITAESRYDNNTTCFYTTDDETDVNLETLTIQDLDKMRSHLYHLETSHC